MANVKRLKKDLVKCTPEELKDVLSFMTDEEEVVVEEKKEETKEEVKPKVEVKKEEPKKEVGLTEDRLVEILKEFGMNFQTKEEAKEIKDKIEKVEKKATPFGVKPKVEKVEVNEQPQLNDILSKLNSKFV